MLPVVISESQSAFVPGRLISDNALVDFETHHFIKPRTAGAKALMSVKLDMSKAFDRIEWSFVKAMLLATNSLINLVDLIMKCISSAYSLLCLVGLLLDPLNLKEELGRVPYIFIICSEVFSSILQDLQFCGQIHGIKVARTVTLISHLLFADDMLLLGVRLRRRLRN